MVKSFIVLLFFLFLIKSSLAQERTFLREYTHQVGDADSKITSRTIALNQVKKILLEEIGVYIESTFKMETTETNEGIKELTQNQIVSITAGITETEILEEKWNGIEFYIKAKITLDIDNIKNKLAEIARDRDKTKQLEDANNRANKTYSELIKIKDELEYTITEKKKIQLELEYATKSVELSALDWFRKGYNSNVLHEYDNAILYYQKAVKLNSNICGAYYNMSRIYYDKKKYWNAIAIMKEGLKNCENKFYYIEILGDSYYFAEIYDSSAYYLEKLIQYPTFDSEENLTKEFLCQKIGYSYYQENEYLKSIKAYKNAMHYWAENSRHDLFINKYFAPIGDIYFKMGDLENSLYYFKKDPENDISKKIIHRLLELNKFAELFEFYDATIKFTRKTSSRFDRFVLMVTMDEFSSRGISEPFEKSLKVLIDTSFSKLKIEPQNPSIYYDLAGWYFHLKNYEKALFYYYKAVEFDYKNQDILYLNIGNVCFSKGDIVGQIVAYKSAAKLGNSVAQSWLKYKDLK